MANMMNFFDKKLLLTGVVAAAMLSGAFGARAQTQGGQEAMAVVQAGIKHTRGEFHTKGPLFLDLENHAFKPLNVGVETALAGRIGAPVRRIRNAFRCVEGADGDATCSGTGVILTPSTPTVAGDSATVVLHYLFVNLGGGIGSVSIELLLERSKGRWTVVREMGREIT